METVFLVEPQSISLAGRSGQTKRCVDLGVSIVLVILLAPLMVAIAFAIKLTSPGPVFFVQKRGHRGKKFVIFKFRTMKVRTGKLIDEVTWHDSRVTSVGRLLRRTHLDELPQLFNVIRGDMSLVGPRPLPYRLEAEYCKEIPGFERRRKMKLGMTGLQQIAGRMEKIGPKRAHELEVEYQKRQSLWLDFQIMIRTFIVAFLWRGV